MDRHVLMASGVGLLVLGVGLLLKPHWFWPEVFMFAGVFLVVPAFGVMLLGAALLVFATRTPRRGR